MDHIFVNFTNHTSDLWEKEQRESAQKYGDIVDVPFPDVGAMADEAEIYQLAEESVRKIMAENPCAVLCQGEFCLTYQVVTMLKQRGIKVLAACSERNVKEHGVQREGMKKEVIYRFRRFREY